MDSSLPPSPPPTAWTGASLRRSPLWGYPLTGRQVAELTDALHRFKKSGHSYRTVADHGIDRSMLPLEGSVAELLDRVRTELEDGTGAVMLKKLPVDEFDEQDTAVLHAGISAHIGHLVRQAGGRVRSQSRGHGRFLGKVTAEMSGSVPLHGKQSDNRFLLHTDVCDAISLLCVRNSSRDFEDGGSIVASAMAIHEVMREESPPARPGAVQAAAAAVDH
ncbi:hypothetical protein AB5J72_50510 [Streptomyces sp. CG1]|uniref:hypothetical protein n=1 Tax=Streptomyces sp. CG1 TaxID=1287523 RepID=UPI0034E1AD38